MRDGYSRNNVILELIQTRVHVAIVERLRALTDRLEQQRVHTEDIQHHTRSRPVIPAADNVTVTYDSSFRLSSYNNDAKESIVRRGESSSSV
jgi:hypothetical protein